MKKLLIAALLVCGLTSCDQTDDNVDMTWIGSPSFVYTYSQGVPNAWSWKQNFSMDGETGINMEMTARCRDDQETVETQIEPGTTYKLSISGGFSTKETSSLHLDSPSFDSRQIIESDRILTVWSIKISEE